MTSLSLCVCAVCLQSALTFSHHHCYVDNGRPMFDFELVRFYIIYYNLSFHEIILS